MIIYNSYYIKNIEQIHSKQSAKAEFVLRKVALFYVRDSCMKCHIFWLIIA